jgi:cytochrome c biogenesis protein CcmG/thiol:disulfide interchange protein DsbE
MSKKGFLAILAAVGFVALLAIGLLAKDGPSVEIGEEAPDAALPPLEGGEDISISDYRGDWVLVNFWASWCGPCRDEAPAIEEFSRRNDDVVVVGIDSNENSLDGKDFAEEYDLTYQLLHDGPGDLMDSYGVKGLPESFLLNPDGDIALSWRGPVDEAILRENFLPLIDGGPTA